MRILITGVAGFIGSNLADFLVKKGYEIVGIDDLSYGLIDQVPQKVEFHEKSQIPRVKLTLRRVKKKHCRCSHFVSRTGTLMFLDYVPLLDSDLRKL